MHWEQSVNDANNFDSNKVHLKCQSFLDSSKFLTTIARTNENDSAIHRHLQVKVLCKLRETFVYVMCVCVNVMGSQRPHKCRMSVKNVPKWHLWLYWEITSVKSESDWYIRTWTYVRCACFFILVLLALLVCYVTL